MGISKAQEREYARILYVNERITFKEIAERTGVTEKTIGKWAEADNWAKLRKSLLTTKEAQLVHWYNQLDALNELIAKREIPIPQSKEADIMSKITANIQRLETEIGLGEYVEVSRKLLTFIQSIDLSDAKNFKNYIDEFINSKLKNG
ncbi:terminase gpP N-terminus-related DNA-binding protein [Flavobacterium hydrophilum]|uniref:DDE transposase family protein n=1 Tax=Flavobacterium hydrophilum TaxID=2211445 RepID=A0A2V4BZL9_9FLAO|nr:DDE transposase family protein [Flavobacterium hydrophilum]PXY44516.1 DDE transposase family protein [Flavobacterium hydrophilum]